MPFRAAKKKSVLMFTAKNKTVFTQRLRHSHSGGCRFIIVLLCLFVSLCCSAQSTSVKYPDSGGSGSVPYNFRAVDGSLLAGGYLFNPVKKNNSDAKVSEYVRLLKKMGAHSLLLLHVPLKDAFTDRLSEICRQEQIPLVKMRMNAAEIPDQKQTDQIMKLIASGTYVHCMWGCDRTGAIIARYLRNRHGYSGKKAFEAIIGGGSHAGPLGGFKKVPGNLSLLLYFWPEVGREAPEILAEYQPGKK